MKVKKNWRSWHGVEGVVGFFGFCCFPHLCPHFICLHLPPFACHLLFLGRASSPLGPSGSDIWQTLNAVCLGGLSSGSTALLGNQPCFLELLGKEGKFSFLIASLLALRAVWKGWPRERQREGRYLHGKASLRMVCVTSYPDQKSSPYIYFYGIYIIIKRNFGENIYCFRFS